MRAPPVSATVVTYHHTSGMEFTVFVAGKDLRFAKGRFALMGSVIVLITLLVGLLSGLTAGLGRENISAIVALPADHIVFSAPIDGQKLSFADSTLTQDQCQQWAHVPGVTRAEPLGVTTTRATAGQRTAALTALGVPSGSTLTPNPIRPGTATLSQEAATSLNLHPGQTLTLGGQQLTVATITGTASFSHTPVIWVDAQDWQHLSGGHSYATVVALTTTSDADLTGADQKLDTHTTTRDDALTAIGAYAAENSSLQLMRDFLFVISALVVGAFFTVWTIQRGGDVAVLKALGASTGYLLRDALGQAVLLLTTGTALGTALAVGLGALIGRTVPFVLDVGTVLPPAIVMIVLGVVGAALSIRRITSVDPLTALGGTR